MVIGPVAEIYENKIVIQDGRSECGAQVWRELIFFPNTLKYGTKMASFLSTLYKQSSR